MGRIDETLEMLRQHSAEHDAVAVSYSAGKDSMAVMDLCVRSFKRVEAFYLYLVPGLECIDADLAEAEKRYGISIRQYPNPILRDALKGGTYCPNHFSTDQLPQWKLRDVYALVSLDTGAKLIANGAKRADSMQRRAYVGTLKDILHPIAGWSQLDVLAYMKLRNLPIPRTQQRTLMSGIDLTTPGLLWLFDNYPDDFKRVEQIFPYVGAVPARRKFYGVAA